jgi:hypothetical protein
MDSFQNESRNISILDFTSLLSKFHITRVSSLANRMVDKKRKLYIYLISLSMAYCGLLFVIDREGGTIGVVFSVCLT